MCHLSAIADVADRVVPSTWRVGLFGSATRCPGDGTCTAGKADIDLHERGLEHAQGAERVGVDIRLALVTRVGALELVADVTLLSEREVVSTGFWEAESAVALCSAIAACDRRGTVPGSTDTA